VPLRELLEELFATIADRQRKIGRFQLRIENRILVVGSQTLRSYNLKILIWSANAVIDREAQNVARRPAFAYRTYARGLKVVATVTMALVPLLWIGGAGASPRLISKLQSRR